jgi:hypothetical protein
VPVNGGTVSEDRGRPANIAEQRTYDNLMKFRWGGMKEKKNFYLDDKAMMVPQALQQLVINMGDMYSNEISRMMSVKMSLDSGRQTLPPGTDVAAYKANLDKTAEEYRTKAVKLLDLIAAEIPENVLTYRNEVRYYLAMLYMEFGEDKKGEQWMDKCMNNANQYARYFKQFNQRGNSTAAEQYQSAIGIMQTVQQLAKDRGKTALADKYQKIITQASRP